MPLTLVSAGAPFAGAVPGVFAYCIFNLWLPLVPALIVRPGAPRGAAHARREHDRLKAPQRQV